MRENAWSTAMPICTYGRHAHRDMASGVEACYVLLAWRPAPRLFCIWWPALQRGAGHGARRSGHHVECNVALGHTMFLNSCLHGAPPCNSLGLALPDLFFFSLLHVVFFWPFSNQKMKDFWNRLKRSISWTFETVSSVPSHNRATLHKTPLQIDWGNQPHCTRLGAILVNSMLKGN